MFVIIASEVFIPAKEPDFRKAVQQGTGLLKSSRGFKSLSFRFIL